MAEHPPADTASSTTATSAKTPLPPAADDSDPDFDDLDDVLDQFSANAPTSKEVSSAATVSQPAPAISGPGRPQEPSLHLTDQALPDGPKAGETEEEFVARLSSEMSKLFDQIPQDDAIAQTPADLTKMGKELEEFTQKMEEQGIKPEDLLKAILGEEEGKKIVDAAYTERDRLDAAQDTSQPSSSSKSISKEAGSSKPASSFEDTIRQTMSRLNESDTQAKNATQQSASKSEEDMLAELLKSLDAGGAGDEDGMSKMFVEMMQQLTSKSMLYEPMKDLNDRYPDWLENNKPPKVKKDDYERYTKQSVVVKVIVDKYEEPAYTDENEQCRDFIWNKMQEMQSLGAPPDDLVQNPFPGMDFGALPGLGGGGGEDEGCPTQ